MTTHRSFRLVAGVLAALTIACGSSGGGSGGPGAADCSTLCGDLSACAASLSIDIATLTGDSAMTDSNCASICTGLTCTNASAFVSCAGAIQCTSASAVEAALSGCSDAGGCTDGGGGSGDACSTICSNFIACASSLGSNVAALSGDPNMTPSNCVSECQNLTCTNKAVFTTCAQTIACSSVAAVQAQVDACGVAGGCN